MESSRLDLLNDVAEHSSILKNNQNTCTIPILVPHPKQGIASPKVGVLFLLCLVRYPVRRYTVW